MNQHNGIAREAPNLDAQIAEAWLTAFNDALVRQDAAALQSLLTEDAYWRDLLAHQWDFRVVKGPRQIAEGLIADGAQHGVGEFALDLRYTAPNRITRAGRQVVEILVAFRTAIGTGNGVVRLQQDSRDGRYRAWGLMTSLQTLDLYPEAIDKRRPERVALRREGENWTDQLDHNRRFDDEEPEALVVGAGHSGLMIAARLRAMGVRTLVVDSLPRVGDVWRNRYHTLQLHNEIDTIDFPYVSYPRTWPGYLPKDMYAAWMEFYALAMELAVWTSVRFIGGDYDAASKSWNARLRMPDGSERTIRPKHVILATGGISGRKNYPKLPGLDSFEGKVAHSADMRPTDADIGKRVFVIGTSTSGHDIALELHQRGCDVTIVQRGPTTVVNIDPANLIYTLYREGRPIDEVDVIALANDFDTTLKNYRDFARIVEKMDHELLEGLHRVGFRTDPGYLDGGYFANYLHRGGGYYLNVGASEYIVDGRIKLQQNDQIAHYEAKGARLVDGTLLEADIIVLATGYLNQEVDIRDYFGDAVAAKVGKVWGWDEGGELRRAWRPTGQEGLWLQLGGVPQSRTYSKILALQVVAELRGLKEPGIAVKPE